MGERGSRQPESGKQYGKITGFIACLYPLQRGLPDALESGKGEDGLPGFGEEPLQAVHHCLVGLIQVAAGPVLHALDLSQFLLIYLLLLGDEPLLGDGSQKCSGFLLLALCQRVIDALALIQVVASVDELDLGTGVPFEELDKLWVSEPSWISLYRYTQYSTIPPQEQE
jgi:hypothetical protein